MNPSQPSGHSTPGDIDLLLCECQRRGITLAAAHGQLILRGSSHQMTPRLKEALAAQKPALLELLQSSGQKKLLELPGPRGNRASPRANRSVPEQGKQLVQLHSHQASSGSRRLETSWLFPDFPDYQDESLTRSLRPLMYRDELPKSHAIVPDALSRRSSTHTRPENPGAESQVQNLKAIECPSVSREEQPFPGFQAGSPGLRHRSIGLQGQDRLDARCSDMREAWEERAAIMEFDGGLDRLTAEREAWRSITSIWTGGKGW